MKKSPDAFRTISEVAAWLETPAHVLRFWESRFSDLKPVQRAGGRRYYRPEDMLLLGGIKHLLHTEGHTIKSVQDRIKADGTQAVAALSAPLDAPAQEAPPVDAETPPTGGAPTDARTPLELVGTGSGAADVASDVDPLPRDDAAPPEPADGGAPPIGFFFDDSADAAPAEAQSGTFAQPNEPTPRPPTKDVTPNATAKGRPPPARQHGALPSLPDDPPDDAPGFGSPLPLSARLRAIHSTDIQPAHMGTLTGLIRRLQDWLHAAG